jgi:hypothetical protein
MGMVFMQVSPETGINENHTIERAPKELTFKDGLSSASARSEYPSAKFRNIVILDLVRHNFEEARLNRLCR